MTQTRQRDRRVTLALKWHYIDDCSPEEIQQRFVDNGYDEYTISTIRNYLNDEESEEVLEQITAERAKVRARAIERHERKHKRARQAEEDSYERDEVVGMVPVTRVHTGDEPIQYPAWEPLPEAEYPPEATPHDKRIRFTGDTRTVEPGTEIPERHPDGAPKYEADVVAVRRIEDSTERSFLRREQSHHLEQQGEAGNIYEDNVNLDIDGDLDATVELDEETAAAIREADLQSNAGDSGANE